MVNKAEVGIFLEFFGFFYDAVDDGNLTSGSSAFSKSNLNIWNFLVRILLTPSLEDFEHNLTSMRNECNCSVIRTIFGAAFLRHLNENWPFSVLWLLLSCLNLLAC